MNTLNTVNLDAHIFENEEFVKAFTLGKDDKFTQWVVRPLAILSVIGLGIAMFFASAFLIVLALAMIPLLALFFWAFKIKVERDMKRRNPVVDTHTEDGTQIIK